MKHTVPKNIKCYEYVDGLTDKQCCKTTPRVPQTSHDLTVDWLTDRLTSILPYFQNWIKLKFDFYLSKFLLKLLLWVLQNYQEMLKYQSFFQG